MDALFSLLLFSFPSTSTTTPLLLFSLPSTSTTTTIVVLLLLQLLLLLTIVVLLLILLLSYYQYHWLLFFLCVKSLVLCITMHPYVLTCCFCPLFCSQILSFTISCCSMFAKQLLLFLPNLPSPLLSFILPMMKLSKSIHYMKYELMIKNL